MSTVTTAPPQERDDRTLVVCGYLFAVLVPFVGLILGIIAATRSNVSLARRHGVPIIVVSTLCFFGWVGIAIGSLQGSSSPSPAQVVRSVQATGELERLEAYNQCMARAEAAHESLNGCGAP